MQLPPNIAEWPAEWRELWSERAGIMEHEGKMSKYAAERLAELDTRKTAEQVR